MLQRADFSLLVPLAVYVVLRMFALGVDIVPSGAASVAYGYPWWARINLVIVSVATYVRLLVVPWGQTTYYGHLRASLFGWPLLELAILILTSLAFRPLALLLGRRIVITGYLFTFLTLLPVANVLPIGVVVAERCLYLPAVGACLLAAALVGRDATSGTRREMLVLSALVLAGLILSARVAERWRTPLRHWETTAADHPRSAGAHARFAQLLLNEAARDNAPPDDPRLLHAEHAIERAFQINSRLPEAWHARGVLAIIRGDCATATAALERALALRPGDPDISRSLRACR